MAGACIFAAQQPAPDLILSNGKIITVDERFSIAQAVAIKGDRIVTVGPKFRDPCTGGAKHAPD